MKKFKPTLILILFLISLFQAQAQNLRELEAFATKFSEAVEDDETNYLKTVLHKPTFADRILIRGKSEGIRGFNDGFTDGLNEDFLLGKLITQKLTSGLGSYKVIKSYFDGNDPHVIFRISDGELYDYHDVLLRKFNGEFKIIDIYSYTTGEYASETFQRLYLTIAKDLFSSAKTADLPDISIEDLLKVVTIKQLTEQRLYRRAEELIKDLTPETRKEKTVRLIELLVMANRGDKEYLKALTDYHRLFPNDPSVYMTSIDYLVLRGEFKAAHAAIEKVDELVGGDTYIDLLRGNAYYKQGNFKAAIEKFEALTTNHPFVVQGWDGLITAHVDLEQFPEAVLALDGMINNFFFVGKKTLVTTLEDDPFYAYFVKSKEFKSWKRRKK